MYIRAHGFRIYFPIYNINYTLKNGADIDFTYNQKVHNNHLIKKKIQLCKTLNKRPFGIIQLYHYQININIGHNAFYENSKISISNIFNIYQKENYSFS